MYRIVMKKMDDCKIKIVCRHNDKRKITVKTGKTPLAVLNSPFEPFHGTGASV